MLFPSIENLYSTKESSENCINTMKSDDGGDNLLFDHPLISYSSELVLTAKTLTALSTANNPEVENTNCKNNSKNSNLNFACFSNEIVCNKSIMTSTKSKVPDILMINKYYGLIPQKFTISSRKTASSSPNSASSSSRRTTKSSSARPRAKSSTHQHSNRNSTERKYVEENRGFGSENESPEPIKMILVPRRGSGSGYESPVEKTSDPFGPVTKKMSVERYKRWKSCGGGKGRSMNMRSNSDIGQTLSQLDNRLPGGGFNSHAKNNNRASTAAAADYMTNRRVIKIDLNRVSSWDEENYRITTSSVESTESENKEPKMKVVNPATTPESDCTRESRNTSTISNINNSSYSSSCSSYMFSSNMSYSRNNSNEEKSSPTICTSRLDNNNGSFTCFVNSDNDCDSAVSNGGNQEKAMIVSSIDTLEDTNESNSSEILTTRRDSCTFTSCVISSVEMSPSSSSHKKEQNMSEKLQEKLLAGMTSAVYEAGVNNEPTEDKQIWNKSMIDSCENATKICHDKKVASMQRCGKLSSRTISFDDKMLDCSVNGPSEREVSSTRYDSASKKRPTTASARFNVKTFTTPNDFNPPSKVIPWTQQRTAGGKSLTLAERRAKFQRATSIHSSSSLSMECGDEEGFSEAESNNHPCVRPPSSAFRETRKPLHVTQPPEIPTMISQINPNADEDIQIEIEKVAIMLKKMHSMKHFSMSLDSGIEAEMTRASSEPEESTVSPNLKKGGNASSESLVMLQDSSKTLNGSGSESSVSSTDTSTEDERQSQRDSKLSSALTSKAASLCSSDSGSKLIKSRETTSVPDSLIKRQYSVHSNSIVSKHSFNDRHNHITKMNSPLSSTSNPSTTTANITPIVPAATSTGTTRRHPFRKAVSISCEQELLKSGGDHKRNEVNSNANDNGKSLRPKTATVSNQRSNVSGTRSIHNNNYQYRQNNISSSSESPHATGATNAASGSQGSRNRKILIKKALMEINQSSSSSSSTSIKKWGTVGRPRTAPSSDKSKLTVHAQQQHQQHPRKPLKASPFAISGNGKMGLSSSGKSVSTGGGKTGSDAMEGDETTEKSGPTGQMQRASSEAPEESGAKLRTSHHQQQDNDGESSSKGRSAFRQCFSLDESALLGYSIKSVNDGRIPIFEKLPSADSTDSCSSSIMDDDISFLSSKKREQCLKVYEKMTKTGCAIKLETIFRGMLTPSEYRAFMRAAEKATQEAEEDSKEIDNDTAADDETLLENEKN